MEPQPPARIRRLSPEEIRTVYRAGEDAVVALVQALQDHIERLEQRIEHLESRVKELEGRLAQNSSNSHRPPSSDGLNKPAPKSLRVKSGPAANPVTWAAPSNR